MKLALAPKIWLGFLTVLAVSFKYNIVAAASDTAELSCLYQSQNLTLDVADADYKSDLELIRNFAAK